MTERDITPKYEVVVVNRSLSVREAAEVLQCSKSWLDKARLTGDGPLFIKIGERVTYDLDDLMAYRQSRKQRSTSHAA